MFSWLTQAFSLSYVVDLLFICPLLCLILQIPAHRENFRIRALSLRDFADMFRCYMLTMIEAQKSSLWEYSANTAVKNVVKAQKWQINKSILWGRLNASSRRWRRAEDRTKPWRTRYGLETGQRMMNRIKLGIKREWAVKYPSKLEINKTRKKDIVLSCDWFLDSCNGRYNRTPPMQVCLLSCAMKQTYDS